MTEKIESTDPIVTTLKQAAELSLEKWAQINEDVWEAHNDGGHHCGFCHYQNQITKNGCSDCPVANMCDRLQTDFFDYIEAAGKFINEELIPYLNTYNDESID